MSVAAGISTTQGEVRANDDYDDDVGDLSVPVVTTPTEEELVRKGVFSCAVRRLLTASLDEKRKLCKLVDEMTSARTVGSATTGKKRLRSAADEDPSKVREQPAATESQPMLLPQQADVFLDEISHVSDFVVSSVAAVAPIDSPAAFAPKETPEVSATRCCEPKLGQSPEETSTVVQYDLLTMEEATERLAAYLRQLLDRTVGFVLDALDRNALRFLCVLLEISSNPPKAKDVLYSLLSHFYFQRSNMGKRIVSNRTAELNAQQDAAALAAIPSNRSTRVRGATTVSKVADTSGRSALGSTAATREQRSKTAEASATKIAVPRSIKIAATGTVCEVVAPSSIFQSRRDRAEPSSGVMSKSLADGASSNAPQSGPSDEAVRRKILGIVQVLEPITLASLTTKLRQVPAFSVCTPPQVLRFVQTLAGQGRVMLDSGIVYLSA